MAGISLEVWDRAGNSILAIDDSLGRELGSFTVPAGSSGSISVPEFANGRPYATSTPISDGNAGAVVTFNGTTLSWSYSGSGFGYTTPADSFISYGVY